MPTHLLQRLSAYPDTSNFCFNDEECFLWWTLASNRKQFFFRLYLDNMVIRHELSSVSRLVIEIPAPKTNLHEDYDFRGGSNLSIVLFIDYLAAHKLKKQKCYPSFQKFLAYGKLANCRQSMKYMLLMNMFYV